MFPFTGFAFLNRTGGTGGGGGGGGGGGAGDVTPTAFALGPVYGDYQAASMQTILAGITVPISIKFVRTGTAILQYEKNGVVTSISSGTSVSYSNGDSLSVFIANHTGGTTKSGRTSSR